MLDSFIPAFTVVSLAASPLSYYMYLMFNFHILKDCHFFYLTVLSSKKNCLKVARVLKKLKLVVYYAQLCSVCVGRLQPAVLATGIL